MKKNSKIYVAGHQGLAGDALVRALKARGFTNLLLKTRRELDLLDQKKVSSFFKKERPEYVFLAAAKVGGILANKTYPAQFCYQNLQIECNVIESSYQNKVKKLLFLGSSCVYPRLAPQPIKEKYLLGGPLEITNKAFAIAKIAGITMCQSYNRQFGTHFLSVMPTNLYGPNDNFDLENSHVLPGLIRKFHEARTRNKKNVTLWGTGRSYREFLHVDDLADAAIFIMKNYDDSEIVNIGTGEDITIRNLAQLIKKITRFQGTILWDKEKPDGTPRKLLDVSKIHSLGWKHKIALEKGIRSTYEWYKESKKLKSAQVRK